ncbi:MAG: hypothetical protein OEV40_17430 [Acidimicrobiia bacterium]|nr:hypothetical protein [Acidimicrobiia bacterium]
MSLRQTPSPDRRRTPDWVTSIGERLRGPHQQLILAGTATAFVFVAVLVLIFFALTGEERTPAALDESPAAAAPLRLPLDLEDIGFDDGTITDMVAGEGPTALSFCDNAPTTEGLGEWSGNRLTETGGRRRVAQLLVRFRTSSDASAYLGSHSSIVDCESWDTTTGDETVRFTVTEVAPELVYGDGTKQFELQATTVGPDLFLRMVMIRSGPEIAQFTIVSANRQDLALLQPLVATAVSELGY